MVTEESSDIVLEQGTSTAQPLSRQSRQAIRVAAILLFVFILFFAALGSVAVGGTPGFIFPGIFFLFFVVIVIIIIANAATQSRSNIQRPYTQQTAFPPPPPPDTILVRCPYCMTNQPFKEKCENCGAPLPKPAIY